jgi:hypothetical protein
LIDDEIVESISSRWINELLRRAKIRPHKNKYWLTSKDKADPDYEYRIAQICKAYTDAIEQYERHGVHTICIDEQTGIQALERIAPDHPTKPGMIARREYEYSRHGTLCLFGNLHVATGKLLSPMLRQTRTEEDYLENLDNLIVLDPKARYRIIADNLTTHCSESLVRYVAACCEIDEPLGKKGVRGILKSVRSRVKFLTNPNHRISFLFTPRHCSWMNQIEIWFGTLRRKVTRWISFASIDALEDAILSFIDYYNETLAHPYNWTYTGKILAE